MRSQCTRPRAAWPPKKSEISGHQGYMLAEMLMAVAVLAIAATVILSSISSSLRAARYSENITRATLLLQEISATVQHQGIEAPAQGDFGNRAPDFKWQAVQARSACDDYSCPVTLQVLWQERGQMRTVGITIYAARPKAEIIR